MPHDDIIKIAKIANVFQTFQLDEFGKMSKNERKRFGISLDSGITVINNEIKNIIKVINSLEKSIC